MGAISKKILKEYLHKNGLAGTAAFLESIRTDVGMSDFYRFCKENECALKEPVPTGVLFHGSQEFLSTLQPNKSVGQNGISEPEDLVYATDDPNYAIFLAVITLENGSASVKVEKNGTVLAVDLDFVNGPSRFEEGYVHVVSGAEFEKTTNTEYVANKDIDVLFSVPVAVNDLTVPIQIVTN